MVYVDLKLHKSLTDAVFTIYVDSTELYSIVKSCCGKRKSIIGTYSIDLQLI